jgi:hypothetical protein
LHKQFKSNKKPVTALDKYSLQHDLDYVNPNKTHFDADNAMFVNMITDPQTAPLAFITRLLLLLKTPFYKPSKVSQEEFDYL